MIRIVVASLALTLASSAAYACPWSTTSSLDTPSTTAAAQPPAQAPCPTCVVPDHGNEPAPAASQQTPS